MSGSTMRSRVLTAVSLVACAQMASAEDVAPLPESPRSLEYHSVSEALDSLKSKPGARINVTKPDGWVIVEEGQDVIWSFVPAGHYAYPAVVRRALVIRPGGNLSVEMRALCEAQKDPCDKLIREFEELNERMRRSLQQRAGSTK
jgi:hypothetical protein